MKGSNRGEGDWIPWGIGVGLVVVVGIFSFLAFLAISKAGGQAAEKKRADTLQQSVNALRKQADVLRDQSEQNQKFFEEVRKLIIAQSDKERQALIDELRKFQFESPTTTANDARTTTPTSRSSSTNRSSSSTTIAPSPTSTTMVTRPPSTTTTTKPSQQQPKPPKTCTNVPLTNICLPTAANN